MSSNVENTGIMDQSLADIHSLARVRQEHARDERWQATINKIKARAEEIIYSESNQYETFSGPLENGLKTWLQEQSQGVHITKALFEVEVQTKITPVVRVYPIQRDGETWQRTETVDIKGTITKYQLVREDSEGLDLENFDLNLININKLQAPLNDALSFAISISADLHETIHSEPLSHYAWVVLG